MSNREQEIIAAAAQVFLEKGYHAATTRDMIERSLQAHLAAFDDNYPHMFVFVQELHNVIQALQETLDDLPQRYQHLWEELIRQGMASGELRADLDVTTTVLMILGMCNWMSRWYRKGGRLSTAALAQQYARAVLDGIVAAPIS
jgi:AcrR family transcriptional regulator